MTTSTIIAKKQIIGHKKKISFDFQNKNKKLNSCLSYPRNIVNL